MEYQLFVILFVGLLLGVHTIHRSSCPIACNCEQDGLNVTIDVTCKTGYWNYLPPIQSGVVKLITSKGNFSVLQKPNDCTRFQNLQHLQASYNRIKWVAPDAFDCMKQLIILTLKGNDITHIEPGTLSILTKLTSVELQSNKLTPDIFKEIGSLKSLRFLRIQQNNMILTPGVLEFIANNTNHAFVDISGNIIQGSVRDVIRPLQKVSILTMNNCNISSIAADTFEGFGFLAELVLSGNKINTISQFAFTNLTRLTSLSLSNCFHGSTFDWQGAIPTVTNLGLDSNRLTNIPNVTDSVKILNLARNPIKVIGPDSFHGLKYMMQLNIYACNLEQIHREAFRNLPHLTRLFVQSNRLNATAVANVSYALANSSIHYLNLDGNNIPQLTSVAFKEFTPNRLLTLHLQNCRIKTIGPYAFKTFGYLKSLYIGSNQINFMDKNAFKGLHSLEILGLSNNRLTSFYGFRIGGPTNLLSLDLSSNNIHEFVYGTLRGLKSIKVLKLYSNSIGNLPKHLFENTPNLESLGISSNRMTKLQPQSLSHLKNLTMLFISKNSINPNDIIRSGLLKSSNLKRLEMSYNTAIGAHPTALKTIFQRLTKLQFAVLARCSITNLLPDMFSSNVELQTLILTFNGLSQLEPTAFRNASSLTKLNLIGNRIRFLTYETFTYLPALRELQLQNNPLTCTCEVLFIAQAVRTNFLYMGRLGLEGMRCNSPKSLKGLSLQQIHLAVTDCEGPWLAMIVPAGGCSAGIVAVLGVLFFWRYRWHLRYLVFLARAGQRKYREMQDDVEYKYDAFIAYSEKDLPWVKEQLLSQLDRTFIGEDGFDFCLHHRDWLVGIDIVDNIVNSIEQSRRTIIVLSDNFAASQWCQYELAMAQLRLDADGTTRDLLVIILLDNISAKNLTPRLRFILTSKTYLPWSEEPEKQGLFWKALYRSLKREMPVT